MSTCSVITVCLPDQTAVFQLCSAEWKTPAARRPWLLSRSPGTVTNVTVTMTITRRELIRTHTSGTAVDPAKLPLLKKRRVIHNTESRRNRNDNSTRTVTLTYRDPDYQQNVMGSSVRGPCATFLQNFVKPSLSRFAKSC